MILQQILANSHLYTWTSFIDDVHSKLYTPYFVFSILKFNEQSCFINDDLIKNPIFTPYKDRIFDTIQCKQITDVLAQIESFYQNKPTEKRVVILYSVTTLMLRFGTAKTIAFIQTLLGKQYSVCAILHGDCHSHLEINNYLLHHDAWIRIRNIAKLVQIENLDEEDEDFLDLDLLEKEARKQYLSREDAKPSLTDVKYFNAQVLCNIFSKRNRSKLLHHKEFYHIDSTNALLFVKNPLEHRQASSGDNQTTPETVEQIDSQLSFKLSLSETERKAREQVVMPYMQEGMQLHANKKSQSSSSASGKTVNFKKAAQKGQVVVSSEPVTVFEQRQSKGLILVDSDEEFEEEDPDEDLEI